MATLRSFSPSVIITDKDDLSSERLDSRFYHCKYIEADKKIKTSKCKNVFFEDLIFKMSSPIGWQGIRSEDYLPNGEGIPLIRVIDVQEFFLDTNKMIGVKSNIYHEQPSIQVEPEELIISRVGTIGRVCIAAKTKDKYALGQNLTKINVNKNKCDVYYLAAFLNSIHGFIQMERYAYGGVQPSLTNANIKKILISLPTPEIQRYISNKIHLAEELREQAKLLKQNCKDIVNRYLGVPNIINNEASIEMVNAENLYERIDADYYKTKYLSIIEQLNLLGFKLKTIEDITKSRVFNGKTYETSNIDTGNYNIGVGELGDWYPSKNISKSIINKPDQKYLLSEGAILWGNAAHLAKYIGLKVNIIQGDPIYTGTTEITAIFPETQIISPYYLFLFMDSEWGYLQIQRTVKGMTAHSYPEDIKNIMVPIIEFTPEEKSYLENATKKAFDNQTKAEELISSSKRDIEDLIEGKFNLPESSKI
jgi:type I restriction enzyme S subunit